MKKNFLFVMVTAAIFAGCSNSDVADEKEGANNPAVHPNGEVEVLLGAKGISASVTPTRGIVNGWDNTPINVWGLDKAANANWSNTSSLLFPDGVVKGKVIDTEGTVVLGETGTETYYYPMSSSVNFSFFACSPEPKSKTKNDHQITAIYDFKGDTDILWGKAETKDPAANGYNAKYIRNSTDDYIPNLAFEHMLTKLMFYAYKGKEQNNAGNVKASVKSVRILNVPGQATVYVAGIKENQIEGSVLTNFPIYNNGVEFGSDSDQKSPVTPTVEDKGASLGTVMLLPAVSYTLEVTLVDEVTKEEVVSDPLTITLDENLSFERGKGYNVQLMVYDLRKVELKATLTKWQDSTSIDTTVDIN